MNAKEREVIEAARDLLRACDADKVTGGHVEERGSPTHRMRLALAELDAPEGPPPLLPGTTETARTHREADRICGRAWTCACAACRQARGKLRRSDRPEHTREHIYTPVWRGRIEGRGAFVVLYECHVNADQCGRFGGCVVPNYWIRTEKRDRERAARESRANLPDWRPYGDLLPGE